MIHGSGQNHATIEKLPWTQPMSGAGQQVACTRTGQFPCTLLHWSSTVLWSVGWRLTITGKNIDMLCASKCVHQASVAGIKFDLATYKGLSFLPAISCQSKDLHTEVVQLVDDLLQTSQVVAADWAVLATVHNN